MPPRLNCFQNPQSFRLIKSCFKCLQAERAQNRSLTCKTDGPQMWCLYKTLHSVPLLPSAERGDKDRPWPSTVIRRLPELPSDSDGQHHHREHHHQHRGLPAASAGEEETLRKAVHSCASRRYRQCHQVEEAWDTGAALLTVSSCLEKLMVSWQWFSLLSTAA